MTNASASKSYDIRSCQTKTLAVRIVQGYEITKTKCTHCGIPLMEYKGNVSCVICPKLEDAIDEGGEDGGVEIINNLLSGSILGSMSSSRESVGNQSFEELDNSSHISNAEDITPSYSIESEAEYLPSGGADEALVEEPLATPAESVAKTEPEPEPEPEQTTALSDSEAKKNDSTKNVLFMKKIEEMAQMKKKKKEELKEQLAFNDIHVRFSQEPPALRSPVNARNNASTTEPMHACVSPKAVAKRVGINNIVGDGSAKSSYMPAWESKMNSATKGDFEGEIIKPTVTCADNGVGSSAAVSKTSDESRDDVFFKELRQRAANKPKVDPFYTRAVDKADNFRKVEPMYGNDYTGNHAAGHLRQSVATPENVERVKDVGGTEFTERCRRAIMREKEEKKLMESMSNHGKSNQPISSVPLDEMKALTEKCMKEELVPEPFDENKAKSTAPETSNENKAEAPVKSTNEEAEKETAESEETAEVVLSNKEKILKSTNEVLASINEALGETKLHLSKEKKSNKSDAEKVPMLGDVKLHLSKEKKQNQSGTGKVSSSSDSIAASMKQHSQRIVALEAKTLQKYTNAVLATTNPNTSSASVRSLSTAEKDKRQLLRGRVLKLEAEALRKHSEAAKAALHARQALDKMMENRKKNSIDKENTVEKKQAKIEDLSISSSLSTKDDTASHPSNSVESASLSQYSRYEYSRTGDDASREEITIRTPPKEQRSRSTSRDMNPPELNISRTHSSRYHREQREHALRSRSAPRSRMPPNIMLPSLHSASPRHHASPRQNRDRSSRPHLMPYSPRSTPRKSSQSSQRPFSNRPQSPSPGLYRNEASSNLDHSAPVSYKYRGSMTPRTVHEQQHFNFHQNQAPSRNFESMMLASNQTVQERVMDQQQPRVVYSDNPVQPVMQRSVLDNSIHHNSHEQEQIMMNPRYLRPEQPRMVVSEQPRMVVSEQPRMVVQEQPRMVVTEQPRMVFREQPRMVVTEQPGIAAPQQMVQLQQPSVGFPAAAHHDPATQYSYLNSPKVRFTHPRGTQYDGAVSNVQYVNPNAYMLDERNDYSTMRYDGTSTRW